MTAGAAHAEQEAAAAGAARTAGPAVRAVDTRRTESARTAGPSVAVQEPADASATTGVANSGNVNTGAFISGNYSNGTLWRGNYEGLPGLSLGYTIPQFPAVGGDISGAVARFTLLPPIDIPSIPLFVTITGDAGPVHIPSIPIPSVHVSASPTIDIGSITLAPITVTTPGVRLTYLTAPSTSISGQGTGYVILASFFPDIPITIAAPPPFVEGTSPGFSVDPIWFTPTTVTFPGFTIPGPIDIAVPLSLTIPGFDIPASGVPNLPLGLALNFATPSFTLPITATIDQIAIDLHLTSTLGPVNIPIFGFGGTPGFWNSTSQPSSGFYNVGGGGGSGFWNSGSGISGWYNAIADPLLGSASGFYNFGTQLSGLLNRGAGLSGAFNTGALD
ncbi:hypothetical protein BST27_15725, partial [Mycobacterium intermedium]